MAQQQRQATHRSHKISQKKMGDIEGLLTQKQHDALYDASQRQDFNFKNLGGANVQRVVGVPGIDIHESRQQAIAFHGTSNQNGNLTPRSKALQKADQAIDNGDVNKAFNHMLNAVKIDANNR